MRRVPVGGASWPLGGKERNLILAEPAYWGIRHFIFLIHGTWGKAEHGWYQLSSTDRTFAQRLAARLAGAVVCEATDYPPIASSKERKKS